MVILLTTASACVHIVAKQLFAIVAVEETLLRAAENQQNLSLEECVANYGDEK